MSRETTPPISCATRDSCQGLSLREMGGFQQCVREAVLRRQYTLQERQQREKELVKSGSQEDTRRVLRSLTFRDHGGLAGCLRIATSIALHQNPPSDNDSQYNRQVQRSATTKPEHYDRQQTSYICYPGATIESFNSDSLLSGDYFVLQKPNSMPQLLKPASSSSSAFHRFNKQSSTSNANDLASEQSENNNLSRLTGNVCEDDPPLTLESQLQQALFRRKHRILTKNSPV